MKLANRESKSILAKLLASENLTVEHGKFNTASFDTKNRVLRLPIWKEMSGSLYDLLVLHEVGHALFTPEEGLHDAKDHGKGFKSFLNVVEDARIERKIKVKFPGGRKSFVTGYDDLMKRDFFGIKGMDVDELNLIDRINLHYKIGTHRTVSFSGEESVFIDRIDKANTWKEVVKICEDLYEYAKENESETDMSDHEWENVTADDDEEDEDWNENYDPSDYEESSENEEGEGSEESESGNDAGEDVEDESTEKGEGSEESTEEDETGEGMAGGFGDEGGLDGKFEPESKTDKNFRNNEIELVSEEAKDYVYLNLPTKIDMKNVVVNFTDVYEEYREMYSSTTEPRYNNQVSGVEMLDEATKLFKDFRSKNKKIVEYLAKEFEMKKAAKEHARTATANSGILDSERLYTYKYNEHIFKKISITPDGKNHGLVMFVDWSGSMSRNMKGTIDQMMVLVMFCKRVNIPFEVYAFSDSYTRYKDDLDWTDNDGHILSTKTPDYGDVVINRFNLLNLFSSRMRAKELHEAYIFMTATASYYSNAYRYYGEGVYFSIPDRMNLGGTPLNSTLLVSFSIMREFQRKNQVDVINSIFLTDGDSHSSNLYWTENGTNMEHFDVRKQNVILRDPVSKKSILVNSKHDFRQASSFTEALVRFQRDVFNINIVNFFLIDRMKKYEMQHHLDKQRKSRGETDSIPEWEEVHTAMKEWRKNKYMIAPEMMGFNEQYLVQGGKALEVVETTLEVAEDATVAQMAKAFKKFSSGKLEKRKLLSRFINMVAA